MQKALITVCVAVCVAGLLMYSTPDALPDLESGWRDPPPEARPHAYWLWLNGYVDQDTARAELQAMKDAGFGGVLLFDMGARGEESFLPPAGPAFLSAAWLKQFKESVTEAKRLGLQVDFSVVSSWDLGGHWIEPRHASMGLYPSEIAVEGGREIDVELPFPPIPPAAPIGADGKPIVWRDTAVLAVPSSRRGAGHEFVFLLDLTAAGDLKEAVLDQGEPGNAPVTSIMTPVREFDLSLSSTGVEDADFHEVVRGKLRRTAGPQRFALPPGTRARYARLRFLSGYDIGRLRWTLGEFTLNDVHGVNVAGSHSADRARDGASLVRSSAPYGYGALWNLDNLHDGEAAGPRGVYATAGAPPFQFSSAEEPINVTSFADRNSRLRWNAPAGNWTILRYVVMNTAERLKVPSPNSDGWATDHFNPEATKAHMDYVIARLRETLGDLRSSGLHNLYLASYEVTGQIWSPGFLDDFKRLRGYDMTPYLPAIFGARVGGNETTARFLHDYRKTLSDVLIGAYYVAAREAANSAGLGIKSEAGGPGPPIHNVPVDSLYANGSIDEIQGEFWPFRPDAHALWVVKETASAGHLYGKPRIHMESFTSTHHWYEGPQDLKDSADRVFCEGGNHMVWHTWTHAPRDGGKPGWVYGAGSHVNTNVTWWPKIKPFIDYLSRSSFLLQCGRFVGDVLFYYGDGGYRFVPPRKAQPGLGSGYDYDFINSDVILRRLAVRDGRFVLPDGTSYAVLVLPDSKEAHPDVLAKVEQLVAAGGVVIGPKPQRAHGLEGFPLSDRRVREIAGRLWGDLDGTSKTSRSHGKGRILWGRTPREVLASLDIAPDVIAPEGIDFIHRRDGAVDIYFVRNTVPTAASATVSFRVNDRDPELWNPVSGTIHPAQSWSRAAGGRIEVPFEFAAHGSMFAVFRRALKQPPALFRSPTLPAPVALTGPWTVDFAGGPQGLVFPQLISWTAHSDPAVRAFSGTARYRTKFTLPPGWCVPPGCIARLDLGRLWTIADATLNGKHLGIAWTAPFTLDATSALQDRANELVIEVINTWHNKLVADAKLPPNQRTTRTNITVSAGKPWSELDPRESGLFGPVRIAASHGRPRDKDER